MPGSGGREDATMLRLKRELRDLLESRGTCLSMYLPTHRASHDLRGDKARFKNLLRMAEGDLGAGGMRDPSVQEFLAPLRRLADDPFHWSRQRGGLAVFLKEGFFREYRLPVSFPEIVTAGDRFHLKPLLPVFAEGDLFYVIAVSRNRLRLFQGARFDLSEVESREMPRGLADMLEAYVLEPQLIDHTSPRPVPGRQAAAYHGQSDAGDEAVEKRKVLEYFERIDKGLSELLKNERAPLVFAGVEYLFGMFREANRYPRLLLQSIPGNPDDLKPEELHTRAWAIVEPELRSEEAGEAGLFHNLRGTGLTAETPGQVVLAAYEGRVRVLFLERGIPCWGTFDGAAGRIRIHAQKEPGDEDLFDRAAFEAISNGATVRVRPREEMPTRSPVAAVYRY
jgi:hypothetical protein